MTEAVVVTIGEWLAAAGVADAGAALIMYSAEVAAGLQAAAAVGTLYSTHKRARDRARAAAMASASDRYVMRRGTTEPRQLVLGRDRVSGPWAFFRSYGTYKDHFVMVVALASHEIDAVERVYFDDEPVVLDGSGNVIGIQREESFAISSASATFTVTSEVKVGTVTAEARYGSTVVPLTVAYSGTSVTVNGASSTETGTCVIAYQPKVCPWVPTETGSITLTLVASSSSESFTLPSVAVPGSMAVYHQTPAANDWDATPPVPVVFTTSGLTLNVTGASPGVPIYVSYQSASAVSRARVRWITGTDTQAADATLQALLPGIWTANHRLRGTAALFVEFDYDENALSGGIPNVSAQIRGMKGEDPRSAGSYVWSDNQALMTLFYARHPMGGRRSASQIDTASFIAAANACDTMTAYTVGGKTVNRKLYTGGCMVTTADRPDQVLDDLVLGMAGDWCVVSNKLRVKAGAWRTPVPRVLDHTWLAKGPQQYQARPKRRQIVNTYTGTFTDEAQHLREVDFPRVPATADAYITEDNGVLDAPLQLKTVHHVSQAQHVASVKRREVRGALLSLTCNLQAYELEPYDIIPVELPEYGLSSASDFFEVLTSSWDLSGGIALTLRKVSTATYVPTSDYQAVPLSPASRLPSPLDLPTVTGLAASSGTAQLLRQTDGTLVSRIRATWSAVPDARITQEGQIELRWGRAPAAEATWESVFLPGRETETWLTPVQDGAGYILKARVIGRLAAGDWCAHVVHTAVGKTAAPAAPSGLTATVRAGSVEVSMPPNTEADYGETEVRVGASWASGTSIYRGSAFSFLWPWPAQASYTLRARHFDTSGNASAETTLAVTVGAGIQVGTPELGDESATSVVTLTQPALAFSAGASTVSAPSLAYTFPGAGTYEITITASVRLTTNAANSYFGFSVSFSGAGSFVGDADPDWLTLAGSGAGARFSVSHSVTLRLTGPGPWNINPFWRRGSTSNVYDMDSQAIRVTRVKK